MPCCYSCDTRLRDNTIATSGDFFLVLFILAVMRAMQDDKKDETFSERLGRGWQQSLNRIFFYHLLLLLVVLIISSFFSC